MTIPPLPTHRVERDWRSEDNKPESVYIHDLAADEQGNSFAAVINRELGLGVVIDFNVADFPHFMEWKPWDRATTWSGSNPPIPRCTVEAGMRNAAICTCLLAVCGT